MIAALGFPGSFTLARFRFRLRAVSAFRLPPYSGQTWRGGFGTVFRQSVCVQPRQECPACLLRQRCAYPFVFESFPHEEAARLRNYRDIPRPYVIEPPLPEQSGPLQFRPGEEFSFGLVLMGQAIDYLPYFVVTFLELGQAGIGKDRGRYELVGVEADRPEGPVLVYDGAGGKLRAADVAWPANDLAASLPRPVPSRLTFRFLTPVRIRLKDHFVKPIEFSHLVRALLHRVSALCYFYGGEALEWPYTELIAAAERVQIVAEQTRWSDLERYSTRQDARLKMGGVVGWTTYAGPDLDRFAPLLAVGEWTHVGKLAVMGLGKYEVGSSRS